MTVQPILERVIIKPANTIRIDRIGMGADCAACSVGSAYAKERNMAPINMLERLR